LKGSKKSKAEGKPKVLANVSTKGELKVETVFKGDAAKLVREYADTYGVEPEVVCKILLIDALKDKKKLIPQ
jgi:hypothetical protein